VIRAPAAKGGAVLLHGYALDKGRMLDVASYLHALGGCKALHTFPDVGHDRSLAVAGPEWSAVVGPFLAELSAGH
jgi:hypothetical protein